jgi:hypothetical protein
MTDGTRLNYVIDGRAPSSMVATDLAGSSVLTLRWGYAGPAPKDALRREGSYRHVFAQGAAVVRADFQCVDLSLLVVYSFAVFEWECSPKPAYG